MLERLWIHDPSILFSKATWFKFVPMSYMDVPTAMNALVRFTTYFSIILSITTNPRYILAIPLVLVFTVIACNVFPNVRSLEAFTTKVNEVVQKYTMPTSKNPFMNPLLTEITDNPKRDPAAPVSSNAVKRQIEKSAQQTSDIYMDTSDRFDLAQSLRTFHSVHSGTIPTDQDGFLSFLAKGQDDPDHSSAFPSRNAKVKSEGYVEALGSMKSLPNTTSKPTGVTPAGTAQAS